MLLQGFGWNSEAAGGTGNWYEHLGGRAQEIAADGFTTIWFPPPCKDRTGPGGNGYFSADFYDLGNLDQDGGIETRYGSLDELQTAVRQFHSAGVQVLGDVVINHRAATHQDDQGRWTRYEPASGKMVWGAWANPHFSDCEDSGDAFGTDDICHRNPQVMEDLTAWIQWLQRTVSYDGWRVDFAKGFSPDVFRPLHEATGQPFTVVEYWTSMAYEGGSLAYDQSSHRQKIVDWIDGTAGGVWAFDFTTKGILQEAVRGSYWRLKAGDGRPAGLIGWWPGRSVTFVDNHDTGSLQAHWPFPAGREEEGYAYILTHPGIPCVFWEHYSGSLAEPIRNLIRARLAGGVHAESPITIDRAEDGLYVAHVGSRLVMKMGQKDWAPEAPDAELVASGSNYAVWIQAP